MDRYEVRPHHNLPKVCVVWDNKTFTVVVMAGTFDSIENDSLTERDATIMSQNLNRKYLDWVTWVNSRRANV